MAQDIGSDMDATPVTCNLWLLLPPSSPARWYAIWYCTANYYLTLHNTRHTWHMTSTDIVMFTSFTITPATKDSLFWSRFPSTRTQIPPSFRWYLVPFRAWHPGIGAQARQGWVRDGPWPIRPGLVFSFVLGFSQDAYVAVRWVSSFWNDWCTDETMPIF